MENRFYTLLSMLYLAFLMTSIILSYRYVNIGPILTVSSVFAIPFVYSISDLIAELYGFHAVRKTIWCAFLAGGIMSGLLWCLTRSLPFNLKYESIDKAYYLVFYNVYRVFLANLFSMFIGVFLNAYIIVKWKQRLKGRLFFIRSLCASMFGELIYTSIVISIVQFGLTASSDIIEMIMVSFSVKLVFSFISALLVSVIVKPLIENLEGKNVYTEAVNFNPFGILTSNTRAR